MTQVVPEPGWLALNLISVGTPVAMALLGVAVTMNDGMAGDDEISERYLELADDLDVVWSLQEYYAELEQAYPYLAGFLDPITSWMSSTTDSQADQVRAKCALLATVAFTGAEERALGDIVGMVLPHLSSAGHQRSTVFNFVLVPHQMAQILANEHPATLARMGSFTDAWCGSGSRAIALAKVRELYEIDTPITWLLNDPNAMSTAITGLNMVANQIGPDVTLVNDRAYAERWSVAMGGSAKFFVMPDEERPALALPTDEDMTLSRQERRALRKLSYLSATIPTSHEGDS